MKNYNQLQLRHSHPNLFRGILTFACINMGLGLNFIFTNPTFNPYGFDKLITGGIFLSLGVSKIVFLVFIPEIRIVKALMALGIGFTIFWGAGTLITFAQGRTSLQMFVLYMGLAINQMFLLNEPIVNPMTDKSGPKRAS